MTLAAAYTAFAFALILGMTQSPAIAQTSRSRALPSDAELKAAYCMRVLSLQLEGFQGLQAQLESAAKKSSDPTISRHMQHALGIGQEVIDETANNLSRVYSFIVPRQKYLDTTSLLSAMNRGEADMAAQHNSPVAR